MSTWPLPVLIGEKLFFMPKQKAQIIWKGVRKTSEQQFKLNYNYQNTKNVILGASVSTTSTEFGYSQLVLCFNLNAMALVSASTEFIRTHLLVATTLLWHVS